MGTRRDGPARCALCGEEALLYADAIAQGSRGHVPVCGSCFAAAEPSVIEQALQRLFSTADNRAPGSPHADQSDPSPDAKRS
jgi:hypothetical protein